MNVSWCPFNECNRNNNDPQQANHHSSLSQALNRQARAALGDRRKYSLQLTALRLNPSRLLGVQALTLHNP